jgi:hypothetical protein
MGEFEKAARRVYEKTGKPVLVFLDDVHRGYDDTGITGMGTPPYIPPCSLPPAAAAPGALQPSTTRSAGHMVTSVQVWAHQDGVVQGIFAGGTDGDVRAGICAVVSCLS